MQRVTLHVTSINHFTLPAELKFESIFNLCSENAYIQFGSCDWISESKLEVMSRTLVKVNQKIIRRDLGLGDFSRSDMLSCKY